MPACHLRKLLCHGECLQLHLGSFVCSLCHISSANGWKLDQLSSLQHMIRDKPVAVTFPYILWPPWELRVSMAQCHLYVPCCAADCVQQSWGGNLASENSANGLRGPGKYAKYFQIQMSVLKHISHNDWTKRPWWPLVGRPQTHFLPSLPGSPWVTFTIFTGALYEECTQLKSTK